MPCSKIDTLKSKREFDFVYKHSKRIRSAVCDICALDSRNIESFYTKFKKQKNISIIGLSVSKKIGNAVARNKIKRQFRAICRELEPKRAVFIIIAKNGSAQADFANLKENIKNMLERG